MSIVEAAEQYWSKQMKFQISDKTINLAKIAAFSFVLAASVSSKSFADGAPDPFHNLTAAQKQVTSFEKADPNGRIDLRSTDVDFTTGRLTTVLALTGSQQEATRTLLGDQNRLVTAARQDKMLTASAREIRIEAINRDAESRLNAQLTTDQLIKVKVIQGQGIVEPDEIRADKLFTFDSRFAALSPINAINGWASTLNLTAPQRLALIPVIENEIRCLDVLAGDKSLSADASRIRAQEAMITAEQKIDEQLTLAQKQYVEGSLLFGTAPTTTNPRAARTARN